MKRANPHRILVAFVTRMGSQRDAAAALGVTQQYVNDLLHNRRPFSDNILGKLGLKRVVVGAR